jgi:hypothetical protein
MSSKFSYRPERGLTAFAPLPVKQPYLRSFSASLDALKGQFWFDRTFVSSSIKKLDSRST